MAAAEVAVRAPKPETLAKYGLSEEQWRALLAEQDGVCYVCHKIPKSGRFCIDHEHVAGFRAMSPSLKRMYIRGILCWTCNHLYVGRGITLVRARRVVEYLERHERRKRDVLQAS